MLAHDDVGHDVADDDDPPRGTGARASPSAADPHGAVFLGGRGAAASATAIRAASTALRRTMARFDAHALTGRRRGKAREEERRHVLARHVRGLGETERFGEGGVVAHRGELIGWGDGIGEQHPARRDPAVRGEGEGGLLG